MDAQIKYIESKLTNLTMAIISDIFQQMSGEGSPFVTKTILEAKLDQQVALIEKLSQQIEKISAAVASPLPGIIQSLPRKLTRCTSPDSPSAFPDKSMAEPPDQLD
jgi:hypothetical protein